MSELSALMFVVWRSVLSAVLAVTLSLSSSLFVRCSFVVRSFVVRSLFFSFVVPSFFPSFLLPSLPSLWDCCCCRRRCVVSLLDSDCLYCWPRRRTFRSIGRSFDSVPLIPSFECNALVRPFSLPSSLPSFLHCSSFIRLLCPLFESTRSTPCDVIRSLFGVIVGSSSLSQFVAFGQWFNSIR